MTPVIKRVLTGCAVLGVLAILAAGAGLWWVQRGSRVLHRTELIGPETQAFVTFVASPDDHALLELFSSVAKRVGKRRQGQPDWIHSFSEFLVGARASGGPGQAAALFPLRCALLVEKSADDEGQVVYVVSLGRKANLVRMFLGVADSEREREIYRGEKILLGRPGHETAMALVGNNLILSSAPRAVRLLIDRLKEPSGTNRMSEKLAACIQGIDPGGEMPGFGGIVNDRTSLATVWQLGTGAPEGSEVPLPDEFEGVGFRFGIESADSVRGDGSFYFADEEAAAGAREQVQSGLERLFAHFGAKPRITLEQIGSRLTATVEAKGVQTSLDRVFARLQAPSVPAPAPAPPPSPTPALETR